MGATPQDLLRRLDSHHPDLQPSAGRVYAVALRALVVAVQDAPFADPAAPLAVTGHLVDRFLAADAARSDRRPDDVPLPWATALRTDPALPPLRHLLVAASAGINDDLPRALLDLPGWDGSGSQADHGTWTALMADAFADTVCGPTGGPVDRLLAVRERPLLRGALLEAGGQAWRNAEALLDSRSVGPRAFADRSRTLAELTTGSFGQLLVRGRMLAPQWRSVFVVRLGLA